MFLRGKKSINQQSLAFSLADGSTKAHGERSAISPQAMLRGACEALQEPLPAACGAQAASTLIKEEDSDCSRPLETSTMLRCFPLHSRGSTAREQVTLLKVRVSIKISSNRLPLHTFGPPSKGFQAGFLISTTPNLYERGYTMLPWRVLGERSACHRNPPGAWLDPMPQSCRREALGESKHARSS